MPEIPGQTQMLTIEATVPARLERRGVPRYEDVVLTAEQVEEAAREWPNKSSTQQIHYMRSRIFAKLRHSIVLDPVSGTRAFGGVQAGQGAKKKRIDESLVAAADDRVQEIIDAAFSPLSPGNPSMDRHRAALNIAREAREVKAMQIQEDELAKSSGEDLAVEAASIVAAMIRNGDLDLNDLSVMVDAQVVDG